MHKQLALIIGLFLVSISVRAQVPVPSCVDSGQCNILIWIGYDLPKPQVDTTADTLLLPALTPFQKNALEFIRGFETVADSLTQGVRITWNVIDAGTPSEILNRLWNTADIVIPYGNRQFIQQVFAMDSLQNKYIIVNTWNETSCCPPHKGWIQWYPSVRQHIYALIEQWKGKKVVVIYPENATYAEKRYVEVLQQLKTIYTDIEFVFLQKDVVHLEDLQKVLIPFDTTIVFIASLRLPLVFNVMEQLSISTISEEYGVKLYGLPTWTRFHQIEYGLLEKLKPIIVSPIFIRDSIAYWNLYRAYLNNYYENLIGNSFFIAYDIGRFTIKWLEYANTYWLNSEPFYYKGVLTEVSLEPVYVDSLSIGRWENICVSLLRFENKDYQCYKACFCNTHSESTSVPSIEKVSDPVRKSHIQQHNTK